MLSPMQNTIQVTAAQLLIALAGSAAIGALVSSVINLLGQYFERKSRRNELLLNKAVELSIAWVDMKFQIAKNSNTEVFINNQTILTELNYKCLQGLLRTGEIPPELKGHVPDR